MPRHSGVCFGHSRKNVKSFLWTSKLTYMELVCEFYQISSKLYRCNFASTRQSQVQVYAVGRGHFDLTFARL